jgi:hypothetical protein
MQGRRSAGTLAKRGEARDQKHARWLPGFNGRRSLSMSGVQSTRPARHARAARASATRPTSAKRGTGTALYHTRASGLSGSARANGENVAMTCTALAEASPFAGRQHWPTRPSVRSRQHLRPTAITRLNVFGFLGLSFGAAGRRAWALRQWSYIPRVRLTRSPSAPHRARGAGTISRDGLVCGLVCGL